MTKFIAQHEKLIAKILKNWLEFLQSFGITIPLE